MACHHHWSCHEEPVADHQMLLLDDLFWDIDALFDDDDTEGDAA